jgi:hypothetical protein
MKFSNVFFFLGFSDSFPRKKLNKKTKKRIARWFAFKPKIPIWVNFGGSCNRKSWYILSQFGLFYGHWRYFTAIWYKYFVVIWFIFPRFGALYQGKSGNPAYMHSCVMFTFL